MIRRQLPAATPATAPLFSLSLSLLSSICLFYLYLFHLPLFSLSLRSPLAHSSPEPDQAASFSFSLFSFPSHGDW